MSVTVADCLKLPALRRAELVAGAQGRDRAVGAITVLEYPKIDLLSGELLIGNELVISALVSIKDDVEMQCRLIRHGARPCVGRGGGRVGRLVHRAVGSRQEHALALMAAACGGGALA